MDWLEINAWLERYAGVSYDITYMIDDCRGDVALREPYIWYTDMNEMIMNYHSIMDIIEEHQQYIPDSFDSVTEFTGMITAYFTDCLISIIVEVLHLLNMQPTPISSIDDVDVMVNIIYKILDVVKNNDIDELNKAFEELNKQYQGRITDVFGVHESQLFTMRNKIESITMEDYEL